MLLLVPNASPSHPPLCKNLLSLHPINHSLPFECASVSWLDPSCSSLLLGSQLLILLFLNIGTVCPWASGSTSLSYSFVRIKYDAVWYDFERLTSGT